MDKYTRDTPDAHRAMELFRALCPDSDKLIMVIIEGEPTSKSRPRFTKDGHAYSTKKQRGDESYTGWCLKRAITEPLRGNLAVGCIFFRSSRQRIDVDNMLKHVMDAATGICWGDDSQVTAQMGIIELDRDRPRTIFMLGKHVSTMDRSEWYSYACEQCGKAFKSYQQNPRFCSSRCAANNRGPDLTATVPCAWCQTMFRRRTSGQRFCSEECRLASLVASTREKGRQPAYCVDCGTRLSKPGYARCRSCWRVWIGKGCDALQRGGPMLTVTVRELEQ